MTDLVVIHDVGDPDGGAGWAAAGSGWDGAVIAPDLPGHGAAPPPVGGHHELGDAVFSVSPLLAGRPGPAPVILGIGANGYAAQVFALGGRARGLVLVDGLGGPWFEVPARTEALRVHRRHILDTPEALEPAPPGRADPRAALGVPSHGDLELAIETARAMPVPTLIVESPASRAGHEVAAAFPDATVHHHDRIDPAAIVDVAATWWATRP